MGRAAAVENKLDVFILVAGAICWLYFLPSDQYSFLVSLEPNYELGGV